MTIAALSSFDALVTVWLALGVVVFAVLLFVTAPYGRHLRRGWGPTVSSRLGWTLMEAPAALVMAGCFAAGPYRGAAGAVLFVLWEVHYVNRAFVYPWRRRDEGRRMPLSVVAMAIVFNTVNAGLNGRWLFDLSRGYGVSWLTDPRFVAGIALFVAGFIVNLRADATLRRLRSDAAGGHSIPQGGLYRWVSCPNYLGEIVEWCGWALATWSLPGLAFAVWTAANLVPRARANQCWYRTRFADYPPARRTLIPGVW